VGMLIYLDPCNITRQQRVRKEGTVIIFVPQQLTSANIVDISAEPRPH